MFHAACSGEGRMVCACFPKVADAVTPLEYITYFVGVLFVILILLNTVHQKELKVPFRRIESSFCVLYLLQVIALTIHAMAT
jgi:hypothetical protein